MAPSGQTTFDRYGLYCASMHTDEFGNHYSDLLDGSYDCVDRIVLNGFFVLGYTPGGFRTWWRRLHHDSDDQLDNAHLMRMAGRFGRRVRGYAQSQAIPVIDCRTGERKHEIAEEYLSKNPSVRGLFLILISRAIAPVWEVRRSRQGVIQNLESRKAYVNHYSFHIMDPDWGHITIKMAGHPPFGAQIILNGHEYVASQSRKSAIPFTKEGNCFTIIPKPADLAKVAETLSESPAIGRLRQVCERWIYSACLCFALDTDEQKRSQFSYQYSVYQVEYSRNFLFHNGGKLEQVFQGWIDRTRSRLDLKRLKTIFGAKGRPHQTRKGNPPRLEATVERPRYDLTIFKLHFDQLTLKAYSKGERVLRFEAVVHNTRQLRLGRLLERFTAIVLRLQQILEQFLNNLHAMDQTFISDDMLDQLPAPAQLGKTRVGGIDLNKPRTRAVLAAALSLACCPGGFTSRQFADTVQSMRNPTLENYDARRAAYDLKKLRAKSLLGKVGDSHRYFISPEAIRSIAALVTLREKLLRPLLAGIGKPRQGRKPKNWSPLDQRYEVLRQDMFLLFDHLRIAA
jgi:hypothetical protein